MPILALGIDIGGTKIKLGLIDEEGRVVESHRQETNAKSGAAAVIASIAAGAREAFGADLRGAKMAGVAVAGQVDADGVVTGAPNLGWTGLPLRAELQRALGIPCSVVNDVRAAAWAEWRFGAGRGSDDVVVLFIGTGIGGAIVSGGRMLEGYANSAGEIGHTTIIADGRQCHCRNRGCLEAYVGGWAIGDRARIAAQQSPERASLLIQLAGSVENISASTVDQANTKRDPLAAELVRDTGRFLGAGCVSFVNGFNPERLILGGGVIDGLPELVALAENVVRERALPSALGGLTIVPAGLANDAPMIGAATVARG
ncbi:MAG: ROK family protein [Gemmatimonadota bacterium]|nr:ROK family protein [Gemmatimonadota bacterium]